MSSTAKTHAVNTSANDRPVRAELMLVAAIVLAGIALRCAYPSRMSVEHFDEGIYASNRASGAANDYRYPFQHLYAPPLFPSLVEWSMLSRGQSSLVAMLVNLIVGGLTPLLVWHVGRRWFGPAAGISAATLAALSDFHMVYSRAALTDALLCFWFLLAVSLTWEAYRTGRMIVAAAAGTATALAWWTKYTGWLPLAVGASGLAPWLIFHRGRDRSAGQYVVQWLVIAATAVALWSPWWRALDQYGGYKEVGYNHGLYVHVDKWFPQFLQQAGTHRHYSGWLSCESVLLAAALAGAAARSPVSSSTWNPTDKTAPGNGWRDRRWTALATGGLLLGAAAVAFGTSAALAVAAVLGMALWIIPALGNRAQDERQRYAALAAWLTAAWFFGLLVSTPVYRPYPRLTLPWLVAAWMGAGAFLGAVADFRSVSKGAIGTSETRPRVPAVMLGLAVGALALVAACFWSGGEVVSRGFPAWEDRTGLEKVTGQVVERAWQVVTEELHQNPKAIVMYVYGEPAVFFHVARTERIVARPVVKLHFASPLEKRPPVPVFLVAAPPAANSPEFALEWRQYGNQFREVGVFHYRPSDLVLLDKHDAKALSHMVERPQEEIRLYLLK